jgi:hypothetical protein
MFVLWIHRKLEQVLPRSAFPMIAAIVPLVDAFPTSVFAGRILISATQKEAK